MCVRIMGIALVIPLLISASISLPLHLVLSLNNCISFNKNIFLTGRSLVFPLKLKITVTSRLLGFDSIAVHMRLTYPRGILLHPFILEQEQCNLLTVELNHGHYPPVVLVILHSLCGTEWSD